MYPLIFCAWTPARSLPAGLHGRRQSQAPKGDPDGEPAVDVGRDQGPEGGTSTPHLTSTYILRDIARCRPLCSALHVCEIKGPEYWTEPRSTARQTFVVLT